MFVVGVHTFEMFAGEVEEGEEEEEEERIVDCCGETTATGLPSDFNFALLSDILLAISEGSVWETHVFFYVTLLRKRDLDILRRHP